MGIIYLFHLFIVSYLITTIIDGVPHAVRPNMDDNCFELIKITRDSEIFKAFCSPNKTGAVSILKWIEQNDDKLSSKGLTVQPQAKYFR